MKRFKIQILLALGILFIASAQNTADPQSISRGGQLYDKWWAAANTAKPSNNHPLWATQTSSKQNDDDTWRCKECHGWDYLGKDGAYGKGSHATGFTGVWRMRSVEVSEIVGILSGKSNPQHDFSKLISSSDLTHLANFLRYGLTDACELVNYSNKKPLSGTPGAGQNTFSTVCAKCHGADGKAKNFGSAEEPEYIGTVANDNPQEFLHKVRMGQPGTPMPAQLATLSNQQLMDLLAYAQTLPEK